MYIRHFFIFFSKCGDRYKDSGEELKNLGEWWWGGKVAQPKKAFAAKPTNLCFIPKTYMAQRENNSESCPLTPLERCGMCPCTGDPTGQSGKHLQLTPRKNKTTPMTASEANGMSEWEQTSFWSFLLLLFFFKICLP